MFNVIALRPVLKKPSLEKSAKLSTQPRHHVLTKVDQQNSGRLDCEAEADIEVPTLDFYAAR